MKLTVIVNPAAGRGRARRVFPQAARCLDRLGIDFSAVFSEGPGHIPELARAAARSGSDAVVACGGDGTLHEVINGLDGQTMDVGLIPCGTGDDLAANLGIPEDPRAACHALASGRVRRMDLVRAGSRRYAGVGGAGFDSMVTRAANSGARWLRGSGVYIWSVFRTLATFRPVHMRIETDEAVWEGKVMFVAAANTASYGGGMRIAPMARIDDGLLDLVIVGETSRFDLLRAFPRVFSGRHMTHPRIRHLRVARARLSSSERLEFFGDGEYVADLPLDLEAQPAALGIIVPR